MDTQETFELFDVVRLVQDLPAFHLRQGQTGTIVERLTSGAFEVEFTDSFGNTIISLGLEPSQIRPVASGFTVLETSHAHVA